MATPASHTEENNTPPTTACPAWCIGHDADAPDKDDDHLHEATPVLMPGVPHVKVPAKCLRCLM